MWWFFFLNSFVGAHVSLWVWRLEDNLQELVPSFDHVGSSSAPQALWQALCLLNHFSDSCICKGPEVSEWATTTVAHTLSILIEEHRK